MGKLISFVKLDFVTIKPYLKGRNLFIYGAIALFLTFMSGNISTAVAVGMMVGTMFLSYPFSLGDKNNMDTLYITLAVDRRAVMTGRYVFMLRLNLASILCAAVLYFAVSAVLAIAGRSISSGYTAEATAAVVILFAAMQAIQIPTLFRLGYTRAKFLSLLPVLLILCIYFLLTSLFSGEIINSRIAGFFIWFSGHAALVGVLGVALLFLIIFVSHSLSLLFYKHRDF